MVHPGEVRGLCIGRSATGLPPGTDRAAALFARHHAMLCRAAFDAELLAGLSAAAARATFVSDPVPQLGHRWIERPPMVGAAIETALNRSALLGWLAHVTGHADIGPAEGRLVATRPDSGDGLDWHDDRMERALLGITVHLRDCAYAGGEFELRRKGEEAPLFVHAGARAGDIALFDVSDLCEHRITPVTAGEARLVYTGWFMRAE